MDVVCSPLLPSSLFLSFFLSFFHSVFFLLSRRTGMNVVPSNVNSWHIRFTVCTHTTRTRARARSRQNQVTEIQNRSCNGPLLYFPDSERVYIRTLRCESTSTPTGGALSCTRTGMLMNLRCFLMALPINEQRRHTRARVQHTQGEHAC